MSNKIYEKKKKHFPICTVIEKIDYHTIYYFFLECKYVDFLV